MNLKLNVANVLTLISTLAGIAGVVLPNVGLADLTTPVQTVLTAIGGLIVAITGYHVAKTWALVYQARALAQVGVDPAKALGR